MYTNQNHTFVVCAFQNSPYLEESILSAMNQTVKSHVIVSTSTPSSSIKSLADKYHLPLVINCQTGGGIYGDWSYAYSQAQTDIVTLCHQDDKFAPEYLEILLSEINRSEKPLIFFTDYYELRENSVVQSNGNLKLKRLMLFPLKSSLLQKSKFVRRRILSLGNPICCPSVSYIKKNLPEDIFQQGFQSNLDWQAWEKISKIPGKFIYCSQPLTQHRIHKDSTTTKIINGNFRSNEDFEMFCKFWPKPMAKLLTRLYATSAESNSL